VKEDNLKGYKQYDSNSIIFWKWQNYGDSKMISDCQNLAGRSRLCGVQRILGTENTLNNTIFIDTCFYTFVKIHKNTYHHQE
jgi:hypothetical protein